MKKEITYRLSVSRKEAKMNTETRVETLLKTIQTLIKNGKKKKVIDGRTFDDVEVAMIQLPTALVDSIETLLEDLKKEHEE